MTSGGSGLRLLRPDDGHELSACTKGWNRRARPLAATRQQEKMLLEYTLPALVAATVILSSAARNAIAARWRKLIETVRDPYQPELHYMRGPGPKWRAKYQTDRARITPADR